MASYNGLQSGLFNKILKEYLVNVLGQSLTVDESWGEDAARAWQGACFRLMIPYQVPSLTNIPRQVADWVTARYYSHHNGAAIQASMNSAVNGRANLIRQRTKAYWAEQLSLDRQAKEAVKELLKTGGLAPQVDGEGNPKYKKYETELTNNTRTAKFMPKAVVPTVKVRG
jgi:hypothetical protein